MRAMCIAHHSRALLINFHLHYVPRRQISYAGKKLHAKANEIRAIFSAASNYFARPGLLSPQWKFGYHSLEWPVTQSVFGICTPAGLQKSIRSIARLYARVILSRLVKFV